MNQTVTAVPAYGRDYRSAKAVRDDWQGGKDFRCALSGRYLSIRDANSIGEVWIRYARLTKTVRIK